MSPVHELTDGARDALRQLLGVAPDEDLEEALLPYELAEISLTPDGPPYTVRQWHLVKMFNADNPALIERVKGRMPREETQFQPPAVAQRNPQD